MTGKNPKDTPMPKNKLLTIIAGGTILKQQEGDHMDWTVDSASLLQEACPYQEFDVSEMYRGLNASIKVSDIVRIAKKIMNSEHDEALVITGTDAMEELSYCLALLIGKQKKVAITGSMNPYGTPGFEGVKNLRNSCNLLEKERIPNDVYVVMNDDIFYADGLVKSHSTRISAFSAHSTRAGEFLAGEPVVNGVRGLTCDYSKNLNRVLDVDSLVVPIFTSYVGIDARFINTQRLDGAVVAGMGAGSVPEAINPILDALIARRIPVVLSTRCAAGPNHAENLYSGSLGKYTSRGIRVEGYVGLNALQARMRLLIDIATAVPRESI